MRGSVSNRLDVGSGVRTKEIIVADINVSVKALPPNQSLAGARYQREGYAKKIWVHTAIQRVRESILERSSNSAIWWGPNQMGGIKLDKWTYSDCTR